MKYITKCASLVALAMLSYQTAVLAKVQNIYLVPPASNDVQQGFIRFTNLNAQSVDVEIQGIDDAGSFSDTITFSIPPLGSQQMNSDDIEFGNTNKGLSGQFGSGSGNWRLLVAATDEIEISNFFRTTAGFLNKIDATVPSQNGLIHVVPTFNPASNVNQVSQLRLVNESSITNNFVIQGIDDNGVTSATTATLSLGPNQSTIITSQDIENGGGDSEVSGGIGDGAGKWQLVVSSSSRATLMSLLAAPAGYMSNLSDFGTQAINTQNIECSDIDGASIFSADVAPVFLGFFGNSSAANSINNSAGTYGDSSSALSVRNLAGDYGSSSSAVSHLNTGTTTPPFVIKSGRTLFRLSSNTSVLGSFTLAGIDGSCTFSASSATTPFSQAN